jgi:hypothetical protein
MVRSHLLNYPARVHLRGEFGDLAFHLCGQDFLLDLIAMFEELLYDVVAEHVLHQLQGVGLDLTENLILLIAVRCLQLFLDEPRAVLIPAELHDMVVNVLGYIRIALVI